MTPGDPAGSDRCMQRASFAQDRIWFIEALDPESALYNQLICYRIRGRPDTGLLRKSIAGVIRRHDALRTNLVADKGLVYQCASALVPDVIVTDLPDNGSPDPLDAAVGMAREEARRPYNLAAEPLIRPRLVRLGEDDLLLTLITHHTIMDGWSMGIMIREIAALYGALAAGRDADTALPAPGLQYGEYADRQRRAYDRGDYDGQLRYWQERLTGDLPVLDLPFDRPRPAMQTYDGRSLMVLIPPGLTAVLKNIGRSEKATLFMTLLAAWFALLYRYSRQEDIIAGIPVAGRNQLDTEGMIGLCVNTLAIRASLSPGLPFRDLLRQVRAAALDAYENQDLPFEKLVEKLSVKRSLNIPPIFQTLFQLRNFPSGIPEIGGCSIERYEPDEVLVKTDLTLEVTEADGGLSCRFEYPVALFDHGTIARMAGHWKTLLEGIAAGPGTPLSGLRILTADEARTVPVAGRGRQSRYPRKNIARIFSERAAEVPEAVAVRHAGECLTYRELDAWSGCLADRLRETGVRKGDIVLLFFDRSARMIASMLAILKAGGAYLPVSPYEPEGRIARMLGSTGVRAALTDPDHVPLLEKYVRDVLTAGDMPRGGPALAAGQSLCPEGEPGPDDTACVMFTSGSTGTPKGVCIPHRGIARLVLDSDTVRLCPGDTFGHVSDPAFDASTLEIWGALLNGATLAVIDRDVALSPQALKAEIRNSRIGVMILTTPLFHTIVAEDPSALCGLRHLLVGGDVMDPAHAMSFLEHCPAVRLTNAYGPTENTTLSTCHDVKAEDCARDAIPIGRPVAGSDIYILDDAKNPVPIGITGTIFVAGDGLATGYLDDPARTASEFVPDPFVSGRKMYRTGDLGRFLPDGTICFAGRSDGQVKIRGFRVETGEVTSVLLAHPAITQALVTAYRGPGNTRSLAAYLAGTEGGTRVPSEELRQYAADRLPPHMVPSAFTWIDTIPLTPRGKVDYAALPPPPAAIPGPAGEAAVDDMTACMASVWRNVLGLPDLGFDDDFFRSGGHSLLAVRLIADVEETFGIRLPVSTIFLAPTVRQMTAVVRERDRQDMSPRAVTLNRGGSRPPLFCIHGVGGTVFGFRPLAQVTGSDQPLYGIQSPGLEGDGPAPECVEEMAGRYIGILKEKQPRGPYCLLAYCAGGATAYEMACRLEAAGERPGVLCIIDYPAPCQEPRTLFWSACRYVRNNTGGAVLHAREFLDAGPETRRKRLRMFPRFLTGKVRRLPDELRKPPAPVPEGPALPGGTDGLAAAGRAAGGQGPLPGTGDYPPWILAVPEPQRSVAMKNYRATLAYRPGKYRGKIILFMSREMARHCRIDGSSRQGYGWRNLTTGGVDVRILEGDHESILREGCVERIAGILREAIDQAAVRREGCDR